MKIAIEARALAAPSGGVKTYVGELLAALPRVSSDEYDVMRLQPPHEFLLPLWLNTTAKRVLGIHHPDVVHFTKAAIPYYCPWPTVVTIYDIIPILFPASQRLTGKLYWPATLRHAAAASDHIITISEASKKDIVRHLQVDPSKVTVTRLAAPHTLFTNAKLKTQNSKLRTSVTPYILTVSTIEPRKNIPALIRAFAAIANEITHNLVIVGRGYKGEQEVQAAITASSVAERITHRGFVATDQLARLYAGADLFVLPSIYEGWGFPAQEAMAHGVPVIVSDGGSLPEVVGSAGVVVPFTTDILDQRLNDTEFERRLGIAIVEVVMNPARQQDLRDRGVAQVAQYSWEQVATITHQVYETLI